MVKDKNAAWSVETVSDVDHDHQKLEASIRRLLGLLEKTSSYVQDVLVSFALALLDASTIELRRQAETDTNFLGLDCFAGWKEGQG